MLFRKLYLNILFEYTYCCSKQGWFTCDLPVEGTICPKCAPPNTLTTRCFSVEPWSDQTDVPITDDQGIQITVNDRCAGITICKSFDLIELIVMAHRDELKRPPGSLFEFRLRDRRGFLALISALKEEIEVQGISLSEVPV